jgi:hypothetical protein
MNVTDPIGALILLAVLVLITWMIAYSAARAATDDLRTVILTVTAEDGRTVGLEIANHGMKTAFAVTVAPFGAAPGRSLAGAGDVRPGGSTTVRVERTALVADPDGPLPGLIRLDWHIDGPQGPRKWSNQALLRADGGAGA